jgi:acetoin utilization deacetylase AcuC-like enzyme
MERIKERGLDCFFNIQNFTPFEEKDFLIAHTEEYVTNFFSGTGNCESNDIPWSEEFAESVKWTNASLHYAIKHAIENNCITLSPTSGFHHASPDSGQGFCTFSGQVISALKIWREKGLVGCYFDLDGHFGNSIEDSRDIHCPDLDFAIPKACNVNPRYLGKDYVEDLERRIQEIDKLIDSGQVHYLVWAHGADSHKTDDLRGQLDTKEWIECSEIFWTWAISKNIPVTISLFGGYRSAAFTEVLDLHISDLLVPIVKLNHKNEGL